MSTTQSVRNRYTKIFDLLRQGDRQISATERAELARSRYIDDTTEAHLLQICNNSLRGSQLARSRQPDMSSAASINAKPGKERDRDAMHTHTLLALI